MTTTTYRCLVCEDPEVRAEALYEFYLAHREGLEGALSDLAANGAWSPRCWHEISERNRATLILAVQDLAELESLCPHTEAGA